MTKNHNVSETGSVSVLRWMGQDRPTQLGPLERAGLNHWTIKSKIKLIVLYSLSIVWKASLQRCCIAAEVTRLLLVYSLLRECVYRVVA
jgi:hypothetical protein